jgi:hypothetical protein
MLEVASAVLFFEKPILNEEPYTVSLNFELCTKLLSVYNLSGFTLQSQGCLTFRP